MKPEILILGQGLAGTLLAWELERAGIEFKLADAGHRWAASRVALGVINPLTGPRLTKSWRVDTLLPVAREVYTGLEQELGIPLWQPMRVRRFYVNEAERQLLAEKQANGELNDYAGGSDGDGFWIEGAARVAVARLIAAARERWRKAGKLREECVSDEELNDRYALVIACNGAALRTRNGEPTRANDESLGGVGRVFGFVPWRFSKGENLVGAVDGLSPDLMLNRGHWLVPLEPGHATVGSTHVPARCDGILTAEARRQLEASAAAMSPDPFTPDEHQAGVRAAVADHKPLVGRHPANPRLGIFNGLGGKGALLAPGLARQWSQHLTTGTPFEREVDVARLWRGPAPARPAR